MSENLGGSWNFLDAGQSTCGTRGGSFGSQTIQRPHGHPTRLPRPHGHPLAYLGLMDIPHAYLDTESTLTLYFCWKIWNRLKFLLLARPSLFDKPEGGGPRSNTPRAVWRVYCNNIKMRIRGQYGPLQTWTSMVISLMMAQGMARRMRISNKPSANWKL